MFFSRTTAIGMRRTRGVHFCQASFRPVTFNACTMKAGHDPLRWRDTQTQFRSRRWPKDLKIFSMMERIMIAYSVYHRALVIQERRNITKISCEVLANGTLDVTPDRSNLSSSGGEYDVRSSHALGTLCMREGLDCSW